MSAPPRFGATLGNYRLGDLIGRGGMGAVYAAEHRYLGDRAAVKVLHGDFGAAPDVVERFFREARTTRTINHPSVVRILDFGRDEASGDLYLVMELLEGHALSHALSGQPLAEPLAAHVAAAIADGLEAAHRQGIVHRDLKPDNVFLADGPPESPGARVVKILDFGIAKVLAQGGHSTGALLGTPHYMAPEQARKGAPVGPHTDVYALGVVLFRMLTGRLPFEGEGMAETMAQHLFEPPPRPSQLAKVSPAMERLVLACLEKEPAKRPASMAEVRDQLRALAPATGAALEWPALRAVSAPSSGMTTTGAGRGEVLPSYSQDGATGGAPGRSWIVAAAGVVALAASVGFAWLRMHPAPPAPVTAVAVVPPPALPLPTVTAPQRATTSATAAIGGGPRAAAKDEVRVDSDPPGATVTVDGVARGTTPLVLHGPLPLRVALSASGYETTREEIARPGGITLKLVRVPSTAPRPRPAKRRPAAAPLEGLD